MCCGSAPILPLGRACCSLAVPPGETAHYGRFLSAAIDQRPDPRRSLWPDRHRLHNGLRHYRHDQLRPRRGVYDLRLPRAIGLALLSFFGLQSFPLLILGTLVFTIVITGVYGWVIERIAYKPLRNSTRLAPLISAIGMSLILQNYAQISQGPRQQGIPTLLDGVFRLNFDGGVIQITYTKVFILFASLLGMAILTYIIQHTRLGRICRATQQDRKMASILGINTDRVISWCS
jgi:branched-chain amino acid transport system permease protein